MTFGMPMGRRRMPCVASAVPPEPPAEIDSAQIAPPQEKVLERHGHLAHRRAAVVGKYRPFAFWMISRHFARMDHRRRGLARGGEVDRDRAQPELVEAVAQVEELAALGVEGAGDVGGALGGLRHRELHYPRLCGLLLSGRGYESDAPVDGAEPQRVKPRTVRSAARPGSGTSCVARAPYGEDLRLLGRRRPVRRRSTLVLGHLHAEQPLLQLAVGGELGGGHRARDAPVHHHVDGVGDLDRDAEVLLDQQHRDLALGGERLQHRRDLLDDHRREALGRLVHHQQLRVEEQRARDREHLLLAAGELGAAVSSCSRRAAETSRRCARPSRALSSQPDVRCSSTESEGQTRRPCGT